MSTHKEIIRNAIVEKDGTFTRMRLGEDPGARRVKELVTALNAFGTEFDNATQLPRDIAFLCASVIFHASEAMSNVTIMKPTDPERLRGYIRQVAEAAYGVFKGSSTAWQ